MIYIISHELLCLCFKKMHLEEIHLNLITRRASGESAQYANFGNCQVVPACSTCAGANNEGNPWRNLHSPLQV